jgi:hypothetical protein
MLPDALLVIAANWSRFARRLTDDQLVMVRRQLAAAVHGASWEPDELVETILEDVPADDEAWTALGARVTRRVRDETVTAQTAALQLRWVIESFAEEPRDHDPAAIERAAEERVFTAPMAEATPDQARAQDLLVLDRDDHRWLPVFQFGRPGEVLKPVAVVNRTLDAAHDPWGVAAWWLSPHASLGAIPADVVRSGRADDVVAAARAAGDDDSHHQA